jgi:hypothetical protein
MISLEESNAAALTPIVVRWALAASLGRVLLTTVVHYSDVMVEWEVVVGLAICAVFGAIYSRSVLRSLVDAIWHGGMVGGIAAFVGTALAVVLADQMVVDLLWSTLFAFGAGAAAGAAAHLTAGISSPRVP